jgi:hypothetical protein
MRLFEDSPEFIAGAIVQAARNYIERLPPPMFKALSHRGNMPFSGRLRACGCAHGKFRAVLRCGTHIAQQENAMAKGQKRSGREVKETKAGEIHGTHREALWWYHIHAAADFEHDARKFKE